MKRLARQAGHTIGYFIHHTGMVLITLFFLLAVSAGALAYRFSLGPIQIPWLASRLASTVSGEGIDIHMSRAALAWDGYKNGGSVPFYLQLEGITARNATGVALVEIPTAQLVFFPGSLLGTQAPILVSSADALFAGSNVKVSLAAAIHLGAALRLSRARLRVILGPGRLGAPGYDIPIAGGSFTADITPTDAALTAGQLQLAPVGKDAPVARFTGAAQLNNDWHGSLVVTANTLHADDLATYWPAQLSDQSRGWVTHNITTGSASNARFTFGLSAPPSLATLNLDTVQGSFQASNLNVGWIPGAVPITGVSGTLTFTDKDTIEIAAATGQLGGVQLHDAHMRITGVAHERQTAMLTVPVNGSLGATLAVLNAAPPGLLSSSPPDLLKATGDLTGNVTASFPLLNDLPLAQVDLNVTAHMQNVVVPTAFPNLPLTNGRLDLTATTSLLNVHGDALFAGEPARLTTMVKYGNVSPTVNLTVQTTAGHGLLDQFGVASEPGMDEDVSGTIPLRVNIQSDPAGRGIVRMNADLSAAAVSAPAFGWFKRAGEPGTASVTAILDGETITAIKNIAVSAPGLDIQGDTDAGNRVLTLSRLQIGATVASGSIITPVHPQDPWTIDLTGPMLDITAILNPPPRQDAALQTAAAPPSGPLWAATLHFAALVLAAHHAPALRNLVFAGHGRGSRITAATASAAGAVGQPIHLAISPGAPNSLHLETTDGGNLLRALGAFNDIEGGALTLDASYSDSGDAAGVVRLLNFRFMQAPAFAKLLQTLSIYGAAAAASGPGLAFDRLVAPFTISNHVLKLAGARAFSSSLGFTASGSVALVTGACDLDATIVPAYALNVLPSKIPLIGRLFSAEKGGGLFAVRAKITGQLTEPSVSVNPLSALTPGVLRDVFGLGGSPGQ
jgi:hypothetical protein